MTTKFEKYMELKNDIKAIKSMDISRISNVQLLDENGYPISFNKGSTYKALFKAFLANKDSIFKKVEEILSNDLEVLKESAVEEVLEEFPKHLKKS